MARSKPLRRSAYTESQGVRVNDTPPVYEDFTPDQPLGAVPTELPREVYEEMNRNNQELENQDTPVEETMQSDSAQDTNTEETESRQDDNQSQEQSEQPEPKKTQVSKTPDASESFRAIREAKERAERERDVLMQQVMDYHKNKEALERQYKQPEPTPIDDDIDFAIDEDSLVEGKYVKKVTNRIRNLEKQLKNYESQAQQQSTEQKIKAQFPDFEKVVSAENVELLNTQFPEVARTLRDTTDLYSKAVSAYNVMKKFGIHRDNPMEQERISALRNTQKPRPVSSVSPQQGDSPLSKANAFANGLTEELKLQLRREMTAARRGH